MPRSRWRPWWRGWSSARTAATSTSYVMAGWAGPSPGYGRRPPWVPICAATGSGTCDSWMRSRRVSWDTHDRRGHKTDPAWAHRLLLLRGYDTLSARGRDKLADILASDDPTHEISAAWRVKEQLRRLLACTTPAAARAERARFNQYVT